MRQAAHTHTAPARVGKLLQKYGRAIERAASEPMRAPPVNSRAGLKHFGGYLDVDTLEKIAILRARLRLDNSELIKLAVEDLYRKQNAKRAFGE